jgi:DNA-binding NarL/FixJ family response regulator
MALIGKVGPVPTGFWQSEVMPQWGSDHAESDHRFPVAVADPIPTYRRGLAVTLAEAGFAPHVPDDLPSWVSAGEPSAVLLTLRAAGDWDRLKRLNALRRNMVVVALLTDAAPASYAEALSGGAKGVVAWDESPETIVEVLSAAVEGRALLPLDVARALASKTTAVRRPSAISSNEIDWLRILAGGATIRELAESIGYTERALHRLLRDLYRRMGVDNRTEAILKASRCGLLE